MKKKISIILVFLALAFSANAQDKLKFLNIPMGSDVEVFCRALADQCCELDSANTALVRGIIAFNGSYQDNVCKIAVYYDNQTHNVYRVRAIMKKKNHDEADTLVKDLSRNILESTYGRCKFGKDIDGHTALNFQVISLTDLQTTLGSIDIYSRGEKMDDSISVIADYSISH